ncbi:MULTISPECIES: DUF1028 domain-containing protein [unclassified Frankia]|uniref:DUF1028 domain-containing protein n=1 Tax=Frankia TaxID=1854 RepID=UPI00351CB989
MAASTVRVVWVTVSIVARDPETGRLGVATASRVLAVGAGVPHPRPGVGAVAVQAGRRGGGESGARPGVAGHRALTASSVAGQGSVAGRDSRSVAGSVRAARPGDDRE